MQTKPLYPNLRLGTLLIKLELKLLLVMEVMGASLSTLINGLEKASPTAAMVAKAATW